MSYQTGPVASPVALLDAFVTFLQAAGWVQDQYTAEGTGKRAHLHKGAKYVHLRSFINENEGHLGTGAVVGSGIAALPATGYNVPPINWWVQPGAPVQFGGVAGPDNWTGIMPLPAGAIQNYWMFADAAGDNVFLVALKQSGVYTYLGFGDILKPQAWTGGYWFTSTRYNVNGGGTGGGPGVDAQSDPPASTVGFLKADADSWVGKWNNITNGVSSFGSLTIGKRVNTSTGTQVAGDHIGFGAFGARARSTRMEGLVLLPTLWLIERDFGGAINGGGWSMVGRIPDVYRVKTVGFVPGTQYNIGVDQYIVFPDFVIRKYP